MRYLFPLLFIILILIILLVITVILFLNFFLSLGIPPLGLLAMILGSTFSILVAGGLIILIFWSHYKGYDNRVFDFKEDKNSSDKNVSK